MLATSTSLAKAGGREVAAPGGLPGRGPTARRDRGQAALELALLFPILLWVLLGIVDFGRVYCYGIAVTNAARSGARVAVDPRLTDDEIRSGVISDAANAGVADADVAISRVRNAAPDPDVITVTVTVTYRFTPITPFIGSLFPGGVLTFEKSASMVVFGA